MESTEDRPETGRDRAGWVGTAACYGTTAALSLVLAIWALQLWKADLKVPFVAEGDALLHQLYIKGTLDHGWYLHNESLAAPVGQDLHDYPLFDSLFIAIIKLIGLATGGHLGLTVNLYFLLTFPLSALSALLSLRRLGVSRGPAMVAALLFAILPYHFIRGEVHLFLASYFLIPPLCVAAIRLYLDPGALRPSGSLESRGWPGPSAILTCLLVSSAGAYYAFFSCYLLLVAGLSAALRRKSLIPAAASAILIGVVVAGGVANAVPKVLYDARNGQNLEAVQRDVGEAETYGLKIVHLFVPLRNHRLGLLAEAREKFEQILPTLRVNNFATVGSAATLGILVLLVWSLRGPRGDRPGRLDGLALLNQFALILAMTGGLGVLFNLLVSPMVRDYGRFSIFLSFLALAALAILADRFRPPDSAPIRLLAYRAGLGLALVLGALDQAPPCFVPAYEHAKKNDARDAEFAARIEASVPRRSTIYQLPAIAFPEVVDVNRMSCYDHFRPYFHSKGLRWTHGAVKGSAADRWRLWAATQAPEDLAKTLAFGEFGGVYIDRFGYLDNGAEIEARIGRAVGLAPMVSSDGRFSFFPLAPYQARLRSSVSASEWVARRDEALHPLTLAWGPGFYLAEMSPGGPFRWSKGDSSLVLSNPTSTPKRVTLAFRSYPASGAACTLSVKSAPWTERIPLAATGGPIVRDLTLPPGETRVDLTCDSPPIIPAPPDNRRLVFFVLNPTITPGAEAMAISKEPSRR